MRLNGVPILRAAALTLAGIALSLLLIVGIALTWLTSPSGSNWLLRNAIEHWQLPLEISPLQQGLGSRIQLPQLRYHHPQFELQLQQLTIEWRPWNLLRGELRVDSINLQQLNINLTQSRPEQHSDSLQLDLPSLPFSIQLQQLLIDRFELHQAQQPPLELNQIELQLQLQGRQLQLGRLALQHPQGQLQIDGELELSPQLPVQLNNHIWLELAELGTQQLKGQIRGNLQQLQLNQQLAGMFQAEMKLQLGQWLDQLSWRAQIQLHKAALEQLLPQLGITELAGELHGSGTIEQLQLQGQLQGNHQQLGSLALSTKLGADLQQLTIEQAQVQQLVGDTRVGFTGQINSWLDTPRAELSGEWQQLQYPLRQSPQAQAEYQSPEGRFELSGELNNYQLKLQGPLHWPYSDTLALTFDAQGTSDGFNQAKLSAQQDSGLLTLIGHFSWQPELQWALQTQADSIDISQFMADLTGKLSLQGHLQGNFRDQLTLQADIESLDALIHEIPLQGHLRFDYRDANWQLHDSQLNSRDASLQADGSLGESLTLNYRFESPQLNQLIPELEGRLSSNGQLRGTIDQPQLQAEIRGSQLQYQQARAEQLQGRFVFDLREAQRSTLQLSLSELAFKQQHWDNFSLQAHGTRSQHQVNAELNGPTLKGSLAVSGGYQAANWQGQLQQFSFDNHELGHWSLKHASQLQLSTEQARLAPFCLNTTDDSASLCGEGQWLPTQSSAALTLERWPLATFSALLPQPIELNGVLFGKASMELKQGRPPQFSYALNAERAQLVWQQQSRFSLQSFALEGRGNQRQLNSRINLEIPELEATLRGHMQLDQPQRIESGQSPLQGRLQISAKQLASLSQLFPEVSQVGGSLSGDLSIGGVLKQPELNGQLELSEGRAEVPLAGISLQQANLILGRSTTEQHTFDFNGQVNSGPGKIEISGTLNPFEPNLELQLQGEHFEALALPEAKVQVSPQLQLELTPRLTRLSGELGIPWARLTPTDLSSGVRPSADVVIKQQQQAEPQTQHRFVADLQLQLGDNVRAKGFGFDGKLKGQLRLQEDSIRSTRATGDIEIDSGQYRIYGQELEVDRGRFIYTGGPVDNPGLDMRVWRDIDSVKVGAQINGDLRQPKIQLLSEPAMPDAGILSYLLLGRAPGNTDSDEQSMLFRLALAMGTGGENGLTEQLSSALNVDELQIDTGANARDAALYIGKYLSPRAYVRYGIGLMEPSSSLFLRYTIGNKWKLESRSSAEKSGTDIIYTLER